MRRLVRKQRPRYQSHPDARKRLNDMVRAKRRAHLRAPLSMKMSECAEQFRVLSSVSSARHGKWDNSIAPYLVEIMDAISDPEVEEVVVVAPSQSGKSEILLMAIMYFILIDPSPILLVQYSLDEAEKFSKSRIAAMIRESPALRALVRDARSRNSGNTLLTKEFAGGQLDIVGANSAAGLASKPKKVLLLDERDRHPRSAGTEGDVKVVAKARTTSYEDFGRKIVEVSSPGDEPSEDGTEGSLIWPSFLEGTQEVIEFECPARGCGFYQTLEHEHLEWKSNDDGQVIPSSVHYRCVACKSLIPQAKRHGLRQRWRATARARVPRKRSFRIHGLAAAFTSWTAYAQEFKNCGKDPEKLKAFWNTKKGECWKDQSVETLKDAILLRSKAYAAGEEWQVPREVALLTSGWDKQHDRWEYAVRGWGVGEQSWLIEHYPLRCDTTQPSAFPPVEELLARRTWRHEGGAALRIRSTCIDAGDDGANVIKFANARMHQHVFPIKGHNAYEAPVLPRKPTKTKDGGRLWLIGVNAITEKLYRRLSMPSAGAGFLHFNEFATDDYVTQLLGAKRVYDQRTKRRRWDSIGRDEALDCEKYAYAALLLGPVTIPSLALEVEKVNAEGARVRDGKAPPPPKTAAVSRPSKPFTGRPKGSWMGGLR